MPAMDGVEEGWSEVEEKDFLWLDGSRCANGATHFSRDPWLESHSCNRDNEEEEEKGEEEDEEE